jgi:hypothetical protein
VTLRMVFDLIIIALSSVALAAGRPAFQRWKSSVRQRAQMLSDAEFKPFLQSRSVKAFQWAWYAILILLLLVGVYNLMTHL